MAIDFPDSPNDGDIFTVNGKKWIYGGGKWSAYGLAIAPDVLKVDSVNNRVGVNNLSPSVDLDVTGDAAVSGNTAVSGSLTVDGDLTISGNTTTLNTTELFVEDNKVTLNSGATGSATANAGIEVERGDDPNVEILWDESVDAWKIATDFTVDAGTLHVDSTNDRVGIGTASPTDTLDVNGTLNVRDHIDFSDTTPDAANRVAIYPHGYELYVDNAGAGTDNTRWWLNGPDEGEVVIGPRAGASTLGNMRIRSDAISLEGDTNITGNVGINDTTPSYALDVTGDINATGDLRIGGTAIGEWTSFTPVWIGLTVGDGTVTASYCQINELVVVRVSVEVGSTTVINNPQMNFPITHGSGYSNYQTLGTLALYDVGLRVYEGHISFVTSRAAFRRFTVVGTEVSSAGVTATTPHTWVAGDFMAGTFIYRTA